MSTFGLSVGDDYTAFCEGLRRLTQIDLLQYKRQQMERRLRSFAGVRGFDSLTAYLTHVSSRPDELAALLDRMTINVSQLWRNPEQWDILAQQILPELADAGRVRAWSAGCSYGAEAHTLAAVCSTAIPSAKVTILGTDIDTRVIERARAGLFSEDDARSAPAAQLHRWFAREADGWRANQEIRSLLTFEQGDLLRVQPRPCSYDLVLCRNTVIYFAEPVRDDLHSRLAASLRPGGVLIVGNTERVSHLEQNGLVQLRPFFYRKA